MSTRKGRDYENYIKDVCIGLGLKAKRKLMSGAHLKKPYDVLVEGKLKIEAKRRLNKPQITFEAEWLKDVGANKIVVMTVGRHTGKPLDLFVVCKLTPEYMAKYEVPADFPDDAKYVINIPGKTRIIHESDLYCRKFIKHNGKVHPILPFKEYLEFSGMLKEKKDEPSTDPV